MTVVYKAEDLKLGRVVAIKVLLQVFGRLAEREKARFHQEARAASILDHSNIENIHEIDERQGETFIIMRYVEGDSQHRKIKDLKLKIKNVLEAAVQIAEAWPSSRSQALRLLRE